MRRGGDRVSADRATRRCADRRVRACTLATAAAVALVPACAFGQTHATGTAPPPSRPLPTIVVTATLRPEPAFDVPASIDAVAVGKPDADTPGRNASEYLRGVPGVLARDRQNDAQDEQISIRGFGARSTFGVRGVRLYVDGIPATMPDGQGQVSNFDFGSADRIEVLRGPFSALYGNSSGGVIQIFTAEGGKPDALTGRLGGGSDGAAQTGADARGMRGALGYNIDVSGFRTDGYRGHSRATRIQGNARFDATVGVRGKLTLLLNTVALPEAQDPQGLTRAQWQADPRQAAPSALLFDTRKRVQQAQGGAVYTQDFAAHQSLRALVYYGQRGVLQFLAVPVAAQRNPLNSGGVVDLRTLYRGTDLRWSWAGSLGGRPLDVTLGTAYDGSSQHRNGYQNFAGDRLGVAGALRRDERDDVDDLDEYAQGTWRYTDRWSLTLGARHSVVRFRSDDFYITVANPDDGGRVAYGTTSPVAGLRFRATGDWHLYAAWGEGFETPTFSEIGYRPDGLAGLNFALRPARSRNGEVGSKWRFADGGSLHVAWFDARTRDELAVLASSGGRSTYRNVGRARRRGVELGLHWPIGGRWRLDAAYTLLDARFLDAFGCGAGGCNVAAGTRLPGVPRQWLDAGLRWGGDVGWHAGVTVDAVGAVRADDAGALVAPGYAVAGLHGGCGFDAGPRRVTVFGRIDNLFAQRYVGSVIVNQSNGALFEPAPGRTFWLGVHATLRR